MRADPGDHARAGRVAVVEVIGGQGREFQEGRAGVKQLVDAVAHEQLALFGMALLGQFATAAARLGQPLSQLVHQGAIVGGVLLKLRALRVDAGFEGFHRTASLLTMGFEKTRTISIIRLFL